MAVAATGKTYKISEFAKLIHVSVRTLQAWDNKGLLVAYRTLGNQRYYTDTQYQEYMEKTSAKRMENKKENS